jgi:hypothetical protein
MNDKAKLIFLVLTICGTLCILASLGSMVYLYPLNSAELYSSVNHHGASPLVFAGFVGLPSLASFVAGAVMLKIGIQTGLHG